MTKYSSGSFIREHSLKWPVLLLTPILMWGLYWYVGFDQTVVKFLLFATAVLLLLFNVRTIIKSLSNKQSYDRKIAIIIILLLVSILTALLYWGQSPILTYRAAASHFVIIYYFILKHYHVSSKELTLIITIFACIYIILWLLALSAAPIVLFGNLDEVDNDRGFFRILQLNGLDTLCLFYFICLTRIRNKGLTRLLWIVAAIVSFVIIFLSLSRNLIASVSVVTIVFFFIYNKKALIVFATILLLGGYSMISKNEIFESMILLTESHIESQSENNLRMTEYTNFYKLYPFHIGTTIFGNGEPHVISDYGKREEMLKDNVGFNRSDSGYVHLYVSYGIAMLLVFIAILIKVIKQKVCYQFFCYKMFIYMLFAVNVLTTAFFLYAVSFVLSLYALETLRTAEQNKNNIILSFA